MVVITSAGEANNNYEYVAFGLSSGIMWATCNVGADTPEGFGNYFAWGEIQPKTTYNWSTYKWCNGNSNQLTKFCYEASLGNNGFTDNLTVLQADEDLSRLIGAVDGVRQALMLLVN